MGCPVKQFKPRKNQQGVALITVLLVLVVAMFWARQLFLLGQDTTHHTKQWLNLIQSQTLSIGAENYAQQLLTSDWKKDQEANIFSDSEHDLWSNVMLPESLLSENIVITITDLQGRFNLNDLLHANGEINDDAVNVFRSLLIGLYLSPSYASDLAYQLRNTYFENSYNSEKSGAVGKTFFYDSYELPRFINIPWKELSQLAPFITALPPKQPININTAPPEILMAIFPRLSQNVVERIVAARQQKPIDDNKQITELIDVDSMENALYPLALKTQYFEVTVIHNKNDIVSKYRAIYHRDFTTGQLSRLYRLF
ncbi:MAG: general secretion pathway protein K [Pseudomonadales bacterium]|jgi:general secretion pathway protein K